MNSKIKRIISILSENNISAMLVSNIADIRYLSGFTGSTAYMIITEGCVTFFTDGRYITQSEAEVGTDIKRVIVQSYSDVFVKECGKYKRVLVQPDCRVDIGFMIKSAGAEVNADDKDIIRRMRMVKNDAEILLIKEQYSLAANAFLTSLKDFKIGNTESDWAAVLEYNIKKAGARGTSFETIVASGERGAMPHGTASGRIIGANDPVIMDFGSRNGYTSDYTRMVYSGSDKDVLNVINIVRDAVLMSIEIVKPGIVCKDIDKVARDYIESKGFGEYFNHSLGHGVGLDVHELPVLNKSGEIVTEEGMVFTIEPGIYLPCRFGVRLEDTVLVTSSGAEVLSGRLEDYVYKVS